ncbi:hypothetical protein M409DRAFT_16379 [Zasmidium cellare ATCC 36951]|uniref:Mtf2-like C-terminal domain-containing protein n=1 Tax=Zasmidium cellare ATCC 36951 TaxID=1080233 RepID=A0A6A6D8X4_ZASCE|nr:uncharacterized protein M409DRAFT_16379 [Zasmidium cellare ATCC 36951]KAF2174106.1 hypothetical protein M409DRAFT_16379 [Zasmidium cellare ATCC 36951]
MLARSATAKSCLLSLESTKAGFVPFLYQTRTILREFATSNNYQRREDWKNNPQNSKNKQKDGSEAQEKGSDRKARALRKARLPERPTFGHKYRHDDDRRGQSYNQRSNQFDGNKERSNGRNRRTRDPRKDRQSFRPNTTEERLPREEPVPFEGKLPTSDLSARVEGSTMTPKELRIFEQLFRVKPTQVQQDTKADGTPEEKKALEQPVKGSHDEIPAGAAFGKAKHHRKLHNKGQLRSKAPQTNLYGVAAPQTRREFPDLLRPLAEEAAALRAQEAIGDGEKTIDDRSMSTTAPDDQAAKKLDSIKSSMDEAKTDVALWNVLQLQIFTYVRTLSDSWRPVKAGRDFQTLTQTLPQSLLYFMKSLRDSFPGSLLGLVLLPTLKKLGPSAFALGASTELFNEHMWLLYRHYADLDGIAETLSEMDKNVYEFDSGTKDLISTILRDGRKSLNNGFGPGMQALWSTDRKTRGLEKISRWEGVVEERLKAAALRAAMEEQAKLAEDEGEEEDQKLAVA